MFNEPGISAQLLLFELKYSHRRGWIPFYTGNLTACASLNGFLGTVVPFMADGGAELGLQVIWYNGTVEINADGPNCYAPDSTYYVGVRCRKKKKKKKIKEKEKVFFCCCLLFCLL
jgi:hypothetical protein